MRAADTSLLASRPKKNTYRAVFLISGYAPPEISYARAARVRPRSSSVPIRSRADKDQRGISQRSKEGLLPSGDRHVMD